MNESINKVCWECGVSANVLTCLKLYKAPPLKVAYTQSTWHPSVCDVCEKRKDVTEPRDFFYPNFSLLRKNWILKLRKVGNPD